MKWSQRVVASALVAVLAAALSVGGCGDDDVDGDAASPAPTASENERENGRSAGDCPLTTEQVREVTGHEVEQVDLAVGCRWEYEAVDEATASITYAEVTYTPLPAAALTEEGLAEEGGRPVDGIGDEAYTVLPNGLLVRVGDVAFQIDVDTNADDAADLALAEELAGLVIAGR